ncbi:hypothetical protein GALL_390640 [mine drainage metagenome]|uniref:GGDEF domain-containing protein n=1 Tax=mine drainage metagenome TaxID=410659 RepID=A0A1J5Q675_9ZZZZ
MAAAPDGAGKSPAERGIDFHQGIRLPEVPHILDYKALQNYVLAISRIGLLDTRIFAFKVKGVGKIYAGATSEDFVSVLTCVAQSISGSMKTSEFFLAYAGEGAFVCVARGRTAQNLGKIEQDTNRRIRRAHLTDSAGIPIDAPVRVGPQIRGGLIRSGQSVVDAMQVAITKAEERTCLESDDDESKSALFELFDVLMPYNTVLRPKSAVAQVNNYQTERALAAAFRAASTEH